MAGDGEPIEQGRVFDVGTTVLEGYEVLVPGGHFLHDLGEPRLHGRNEGVVEHRRHVDGRETEQKQRKRGLQNTP